MSIHSSLKSRGGPLSTLRKVMKRHERVRALLEQGKWKEGQSVYGLPKVIEGQEKSS